MRSLPPGPAAAAMAVGMLAWATSATAAGGGGPPSSAGVARLDRALDTSMRRAGPTSGAYVYDLTTKHVLYRRRAATPRFLASNTKLFTTAAALGRFGAAGRLTTSVWSEGAHAPRPKPSQLGTGESPAGGESPAPPTDPERAPAYTLEGDLYLRGGGDPALGSARFADRYLQGLVTRAIALADRLAATGLRRVSGRLYADDTLFDRRRGVPYSAFRMTGYIGPLSALAYNSGFAGDLERRFAPDPARFAADQLREALRRRGIRIARGVALRRVPRSAVRLAAVRSPRMADLVAETNRESNNFFAEMLLKGLGARFGSAGTTGSGAAVVESFARSQGSRIAAYDGSGLTRSNAASPRAVVRLLRRMLAHPAYASFVGSLAIAGRNGTLHNRMRGTAAQDACRGKTGTIDGVSNLSGYCRTRSGHELAFAFLMNGVSVYTARRLQDSMAEALARYRG